MKTLLASARFLAHPGRLFGGKNVLKYLLRSLVLFPWAQFWARHLLADAQRRELLAMHPRLLLKPQRPYLRKQACPGSRLRWLVQHYTWVRQHWPWAFVQALYRQGGTMLAQVEGASARYQLMMRPTDKCDREGELILALESEGHMLSLLSFTVRREGRDWVADVGCLQGPKPEFGREAVKQATQDMHGLRPKQAVLTALYAFMRSYGIARIHAVANDSHIHCARWRSRRRIAADYDGFWVEMGGVRQHDGFVLPEGPQRKTLAEIPSRKRAQYRRRHELEDQLTTQMRASLPNGGSAVDMAAPMHTPAAAVDMRADAVGSQLGLGELAMAV